jgi:hypothetical protein
MIAFLTQIPRRAPGEIADAFPRREQELRYPASSAPAHSTQPTKKMKTQSRSQL